MALLPGCESEDAADAASRAAYEVDVEAGQRPRNVILFLVDTLRADRLGCYGYPRDTSPFIDRMAEGGTRYTNNFTQGCWTLPSMLSIMSGLYVFEEEQQLPVRSTLAELLQRADVTTAAFVGNDVLVHDRGFGRGFDHFEGPVGNGNAALVVERFKGWFDENEQQIHAGRGFFAWLHTMDPHDPYTPGERFRVFDGRPRVDEDVLRARWETRRAEADELALEDSLDFDAAVGAMIRDSNSYDGEVRATDLNLQKVIQFLRDKGELEQTLIVFCADHGEKLYEHPHYPQEPSLKLAKHGGMPRGVADLFAWGHRSWFQDELWRTPMILFGPGAPSGRVVEGLTENLDIYPTILDAFGLQRPPWIDGHSLFGGLDPERERVFGYGYYTTAVREASGLKLIQHYPERFLLEEGAAQPLELLDLATDPTELENLAAQRPAERDRLAELLGEWRLDVDREYSSSFTKRNLEDLRKLGYIGDD